MKKYNFLIISALILTLNTYAQTEWVQVWADEFEYNGNPDPTKWNYDIGGNGFGNQEEQYYTDSEDNAYVSDGTLKIIAKNETFDNNSYTSAKLITKDKAEWQYGKFEIRAKIPSGTGMWPAIWMLPSANTYGGWPKSGEIDIMEYVGFDPEVIHWNIHTEAYNHSIGTNKGQKATFDAPEDKFYTYGLEWYDDSLVFLVDDMPYFTFEKESDNYAVWPYKHPFYLILNTAVGGSWGGLQGIDNNAFPSTFEIDYVRVYQLSEIKTDYSVLINQSEGGTATSSHTTAGSGTTVSFQATPDEGYEFVRWKGTYSNASSNFNVELALDVELTPVFIKQGELVSNGTFANDLTGWWYNDGGAASFTQKDGLLDIDIFGAVTNPWDMQLAQTDLALIDGHTYEYSFDVSGSESTTFVTGVGLNEEPWSSYLRRTITASANTQTFTYTFTMSSDNDAARIFFDLGTASGNLKIDNISLVDLTLLSTYDFDEKELSFYPNPTGNKATLQLDEQIVSITAIDQLGKSVEIQNQNTSLDVSHLTPGQHILKIITASGKVYTKKFMKQ